MKESELKNLEYAYTIALTDYKKAKAVNAERIAQLLEVKTIYKAGFCDQRFYQQYKAKSATLRTAALNKVVKCKAAVHITYKVWDKARIDYARLTEPDRLAGKLLEQYNGLSEEAKKKFIELVKD